MFNLKSLLFGGGSKKESPNPIPPKNVKQKTKETAQKLSQVINDESLETFSRNATDVEILGAVYNMMVKIQSDDRLREEQLDNHAKEKQIATEKRHKEIVAALSSLSFGKGKTEKVPKVKEQAEEPTLPDLKNIAPKTPKPKVGKPAATGKPKTGKPEKVPKTSKGKPQKQTTPEPTPKPTTTPPPKVTGAPPVPSVGTGAVGAAASIGLLGTVSAQMARAESPTGPQSYTQANIVKGTPISEHQIVKGATDVTTGQKFDKDLTEMSIGEVVDLGNRRREYYKKMGGSAMGRYQFIPDTLTEQAQKAFGSEWRNIPFSKDNQDLLNGQFIKSNAQVLANNGIPVNTATLYMMHFLGNPQKVKQIISSDDNTPMSSILSGIENQMNPYISQMSVGKYKEHLKSKGYTYENIDNKALQSEPLRPAGAVNSSSIENQRLNESLASYGGDSSTTINQNNFNMFQPQHRPQQQAGDDRSAYERKSRAI